MEAFNGSPDGEGVKALRALYEAYNRHDHEAAAALYAENGEHEDVAYGRPRRGREAIADGLRRFFAAFPDARWEVRDALGGTDRAAARYVLTGTLQSDLGSIVAAGQRMELRGVQVLDVASGLIERTEDYWDGSTFEQQMKHELHMRHPVEEW